MIYTVVFSIALILLIVYNSTPGAKAKRAIRDFRWRCSRHADTIHDYDERVHYLREAAYMRDWIVASSVTPDVPYKLARIDTVTLELRSDHETEFNTDSRVSQASGERRATGDVRCKPVPTVEPVAASVARKPETKAQTLKTGPLGAAPASLSRKQETVRREERLEPTWRAK
ncbi:hypothetical protein [Paraburkholderia sp. J8-2]|uniref:hypothetical protein n=1 Tax=Paraburkholderia sp. J8-2 TaxID=2805440 RepID=UPI002AB6343D|nr:hypothetical protein [Paraburkholderia sp. J8-2]